MFEKTVYFAIAGTGRIARTMAQTMKKMSGISLYAVLSRNPEKAMDFASEFGFRKVYGSMDEMLKDRRIDAVYIASPHSEHYQMARQCLLAGKAVLCEKAFTVNEKQARELFDIAREKDVLLTEAMWIRFMPFAKTIRDVLDSRVIGDPVMMTANLGYWISGKKRMTDPHLAGGTLLDLGVYPLTFAAMFFGTDIVKIQAACSYTDRHLDEQDSYTLIYRDGKVAVLSATMMGGTDRRGVITGTRGWLCVENINNFESMTVYGEDGEKVATYRRPAQKTGYEYEVEAFARAYRQGWRECPEMTGADTLTIMRIMDEIRQQLGVVYPCEDGEIEEAPQTTEVTVAGNRQGRSGMRFPLSLRRK